MRFNPIQQRLLEVASRENISGLGLRKLGKLIGETHPQKVKYHLEILKKKGLLDQEPINPLELDSARIDSKTELVSIPILGQANCGKHLSFAENRVEGYLRVSKDLLSKRRNVYALRAVGDSMNMADINGEAIEDQDFIIVDSEYKSPKDNDYVVSILDGAANVKKILFDRKRECVALRSETTLEDKYPPIVIKLSHSEEFIVAGKVIGVIKSYK